MSVECVCKKPDVKNLIKIYFLLAFYVNQSLKDESHEH